MAETREEYEIINRIRNVECLQDAEEFFEYIKENYIPANEMNHMIDSFTYRMTSYEVQMSSQRNYERGLLAEEFKKFLLEYTKKRTTKKLCDDSIHISTWEYNGPNKKKDDSSSR